MFFAGNWDRRRRVRERRTYARSFQFTRKSFLKKSQEKQKEEEKERRMSLILLVGLAALQAPPPPPSHDVTFFRSDVLPVRVDTYKRRWPVRFDRRSYHAVLLVRFSPLTSQPFFFFPDLFIQNSYSRFLYFSKNLLLRQIAGTLIRNLLFWSLVFITGRSRRPTDRRAATIRSRVPSSFFVLGGVDLQVSFDTRVTFLVNFSSRFCASITVAVLKTEMWLGWLVRVHARPSTRTRGVPFIDRHDHASGFYAASCFFFFTF